MTSIPASRKARAMTFAPRSWPSRPGFATRTRIFRSVIEIIKSQPTPATQRNLNRPGSPFVRVLQRLDVEASPQVPARDTAVRRPGLCDFFHDMRLGKFAFHIVLADRSLHAIVPRWKYIGSAQRKHQKHVRRPDSDALHLRQMLDDLFIGHVRQPRKVE